MTADFQNLQRELKAKISPTLHYIAHLKSHRIPGVVDNTQDYVAISTCKCNLVWHSFRYQVFTHFIVRCKHTNYHNRSSYLRNHSVYFTMKKSGQCWVTKKIFISGYFFLADGISIKSTFGQALAVFISQLSLNGEDGRCGMIKCGDSKWCAKRTLMVLFLLLHVWPNRQFKWALPKSWKIRDPTWTELSLLYSSWIRPRSLSWSTLTHMVLDQVTCLMVVTPFSETVFQKLMNKVLEDTGHWKWKV